VLLGENRGELGGSEYLKMAHGLVRGRPPEVDLAAERALQRLLVAAASEGLVRSAHDCSEGGVAVTLSECCFGAGGIGLAVDVPRASVPQPAGWEWAAALFGESASRVVVSVAEDRLNAFLDRARILGVPARTIGRTGGSRIRISVDGEAVVDLALAETEIVWKTALERYFAGRAA
jgi:phosphoribosylformylglycinamidine (FGAM) synthase-like enzyme